MTELDPQPPVLRAIEAASSCHAAVDAALGAGLPPHAHSCALMIRGEVSHLIRRLSYIAGLVEIPEPGIQRAREIHGDNETGDAGTG